MIFAQDCAIQRVGAERQQGILPRLDPLKDYFELVTCSGDCRHDQLISSVRVLQLKHASFTLYLSQRVSQ
jgi:hypothetical protein